MASVTPCSVMDWPPNSLELHIVEATKREKRSRDEHWMTFRTPGQLKADFQASYRLSTFKLAWFSINHNIANVLKGSSRLVPTTVVYPVQQPSALCKCSFLWQIHFPSHLMTVCTDRSSYRNTRKEVRGHCGLSYQCQNYDRQTECSNKVQVTPLRY